MSSTDGTAPTRPARPPTAGSRPSRAGGSTSRLGYSPGLPPAPVPPLPPGAGSSLAPPNIGYVAPAPPGAYMAPSGAHRPQMPGDGVLPNYPAQGGRGAGYPPGPPGNYGPPRPGYPPDMPGSAGLPRPGMRPKKRLIVCCDGTWLDSDNSLQHNQLQLASNVTRIGRAIRAETADGISQIVYYQGGVGTEGGPVSRAVGGATAEGLSENIREAYSFLAHNHSDGDEIFLFGFSRGAFTARSIAGLIGAIGLLTKDGIKDLGVIFKDVAHQHSKTYKSDFPDAPFPKKPPASDPRYADELLRRGLTRLPVSIKAVSVWDTVGSLGIPRVLWLERLGLQSKGVKEFKFYDTSLTDNIENAFQALALDEKRSAFVPTLWEKPKGNRTNLRQVWFPGVHSNVGGGYPDQELANISLIWMVAQLEGMLDFNHEYIAQQVANQRQWYNHTAQKSREWSFGEIYRSLSGPYVITGTAVRKPGFYTRTDPITGRSTGRKLRDTCEYIHPSVRARYILKGPGAEDKGIYEPLGLAEYRLKITGAAFGGDQPMAVWESREREPDDGGGPDGGSLVNGSNAPGGKSGRRRRGKKKVLFESPLFPAELRLLAGSPNVERYVLHGDTDGIPGAGSGRRHRRNQSAAGPPPLPLTGPPGGPGPYQASPGLAGPAAAAGLAGAAGMAAAGGGPNSSLAPPRDGRGHRRRKSRDDDRPSRHRRHRSANDQDLGGSSRRKGGSNAPPAAPQPPPGVEYGAGPYGSIGGPSAAGGGGSGRRRDSGNRRSMPMPMPYATGGGGGTRGLPGSGSDEGDSGSDASVSPNTETAHHNHNAKGRGGGKRRESSSARRRRRSGSRGSRRRAGSEDSWD